MPNKASRVRARICRRGPAIDAKASAKSPRGRPEPCRMADSGDARAAAQREQDGGNAAVARRDWAAAHERYSASLALHATAAAYSNRAAARLALNRAAEAVEDARAALALDASFVRAYVRLSAAHRALGDDAAALAAARDGISVAERVGSPLARQLRESAAQAAGAAPPRFERCTPEARELMHSVCAHCGTLVEHRRICASCRKVAYCNEACQRAGWPAHRAACKRMAAATASAATDVGLTELPGPECTNAVANWAAENKAHWAALRAMAWHIQHALPRERGGTGAAYFKVLRGRAGDATLRVQLMPLAVLKMMSRAGTDDDVDMSTQTAGLMDTLSRVDVEIGFMMGVDDQNAVSAVSSGRVRYGAPTELIREASAQAVREGRLRINTVQLTAEMDTDMFQARE